MNQSEFANRLRDLERRALSWVVEQRRYFNPLCYTEILKVDLALKASAELALVCDHAYSDRTQGSLREYQQLASYLWDDVFSGEALRDYLLTTEVGLLTFGFYASLRQCGYQDKQYERKLQALLNDGYLSAAERVATRDLDFLHSLQRLDLPCDRELQAQAYARCLVGKHPSLYPLTTDDAYAFTHAIFFVTDFGRASGCFSSTDLAYLKSALPRLLEYYLRKGNWDLVAELLICLQATGLARISAYNEGWGLLFSGQQEDGSFPGPTGDQHGRLWAEAEKRDDDADVGWRRFHDNYHTTLVALMACRGARSLVSGTRTYQ
jgi:hypothetical protein